MSGYWQNTLSNQPGGSLYMTTWGSKSSCESAQAATGSIVYPDQCRYVDTTPAVQDITIIQDPFYSVTGALKGIPKEFLLIGIVIIVLIFIMRR